MLVKKIWMNLEKINRFQFTELNIFTESFSLSSILSHPDSSGTALIYFGAVIFYAKE